MAVRMAAVGLRFGGRWAAAIQAHPDLELAAVCDRNPSVAATTAASYGVPAFVDYQDLLDADVDAIALFTPAPLHARQAIQALSAGKHVLCSVPAALTLEECRSLIAAVEQSGRQYMMAETSNWYPEVLHARELAAAGAFGEFFLYESEYLHTTPELWHDADGSPTWRWGFPPLKYITHCSGPLFFVTGQYPTEVTALGWGRQPTGWSEPYGNPFTLGTGIFRLSGGGLARMTVCSRLERPELMTFRFYGTERTLEGRRSRDAMDLLATRHGAELIAPAPSIHRLPPSLQSLMQSSPGHSGAEYFIVNDFAAALLTGNRPSIDVYDAVGYTACGICAQQSALEERPVVIPRFERPALVSGLGSSKVQEEGRWGQSSRS